MSATLSYPGPLPRKHLLSNWANKGIGSGGGVQTTPTPSLGRRRVRGEARLEQRMPFRRDDSRSYPRKKRWGEGSRRRRRCQHPRREAATNYAYTGTTSPCRYHRRAKGPKGAPLVAFSRRCHRRRRRLGDGMAQAAGTTAAGLIAPPMRRSKRGRGSSATTARTKAAPCCDRPTEGRGRRADGGGGRSNVGGRPCSTEKRLRAQGLNRQRMTNGPSVSRTGAVATRLRPLAGCVH